MSKNSNELEKVLFECKNQLRLYEIECIKKIDAVRENYKQLKLREIQKEVESRTAARVNAEPDISAPAPIPASIQFPVQARLFDPIPIPDPTTATASLLVPALKK